MKKLTFCIISIFIFTAFQYALSQNKSELSQMLKTNPKEFRVFLEKNPNAVINLKGEDLSGVDFSNMNLSGADLSYCKLNKANFKESNLRKVNLIGADIKNANFDRANLTNANLNKSNATGATFTETILENCVFDYLMIQTGNQLDPAFISPEGLVVLRKK